MIFKQKKKNFFFLGKKFFFDLDFFSIFGFSKLAKTEIFVFFHFFFNDKVRNPFISVLSYNNALSMNKYHTH